MRPLLIATVLSDLPHVVACISSFLDSSIDLPLSRACRFSSLELLDRLWGAEPPSGWSLLPFLHKDRHYQQHQFVLALHEAVRSQHVPTVQWLFEHLQGCVVDAAVVLEAVRVGSLEILQCFFENDSQRVLGDQANSVVGSGVGHRVEWSSELVCVAAETRRCDIIWWLLENLPAGHHDLDKALEAAVKVGDIPVAEWLLQKGARWGRRVRELRPAHRAAGSGRLDVLKWLERMGELEGVQGLVVRAAEGGHIQIVRWLVERDARYYGEGELLGQGSLTELGGEVSLSIHSAAVNGHLEVAKYLRACMKLPANKLQRDLQAKEQRRHLAILSRDLGTWSGVDVVSGKTMTMAAKRGFLAVVKWLYIEYGDDPDVKIFQYGPRQRWQQASDIVVMDAAACNLHFDVLQYLRQLYVSITADTRKRKRDGDEKPETPRYTSKAVFGPAAKGDLAMVQWFYRLKYHCHSHTIDVAATAGQLKVVKWLNTLETVALTTAAMDGAARNGHLEVVQWLHSNTSAGCTSAAMDGAATNGHLGVVKWLHEHRTEGCTTAAMDGAAAHNALDVVKWLHRNRTEGCTSQAMDSAAKEGHFRVVQWLHTHRSEGCTTAAIDDAATNNHFEVLLFLHSQRHLACTQAAETLAAVNEVRAIHGWILAHKREVREG